MQLIPAYIRSRSSLVWVTCLRTVQMAPLFWPEPSYQSGGCKEVTSLAKIPSIVLIARHWRQGLFEPCKAPQSK